MVEDVDAKRPRMGSLRHSTVCFCCNYRCYIKLYTEYVHANYKDVASNNNCYVCLDLSIYYRRKKGG